MAQSQHVPDRRRGHLGELLVRAAAAGDRGGGGVRRLLRGRHRRRRPLPRHDRRLLRYQERVPLRREALRHLLLPARGRSQGTSIPTYTSVYDIQLDQSVLRS